MSTSPLEATTHDEALTKARALFGDDAQVGVRLARTGGVLGFFATEKYVAEVLDEPTAVTATTAPLGHGVANGGTGLADAIADYSNLLGAPEPAQSNTTTRPTTARTTARPSVPNRPAIYTVHAASAPFVSMVATEAYLTDHSPTFAPSVPAPKMETPTEVVEVVPETTTGPVSPFAAALSRMSVEAEVADAVAVVVEEADTEAIHAALAPAPSPVHVPTAATVLRPSHPIPRPDVGATIDAIVGEAMATTQDPSDPAVPVEAPQPLESRLVATPIVAPPTVAYNLAGALVADRGTDLPAAPLPIAPDEEPVAAPVADVPTADTQMAVMASNIPHPTDPTGLLPRLGRVGFPTAQIPDLFLHEVEEKGIHTALTRLIKMRTAPAPALPVAPCTVVFVGPGTEALTAAMQACGSLRADASQVAWVGPAHLSALVPSTRRISTPEGATTWLSAPKRATVVNVIAIHTPLTENVEAHTRAVIAALNPTMVLAVVDATRKSEAVTRWVEALDCVDAVALENASETHDSATWLGLAAAPVALIEGRKATAARWSSMLCERLTDMEG